MAVKRKYRLNLRNYGNLPAIMLSQYDEGYALEFEIRDGTDAASDLSAYTVTLKGTRADTLAYSFAGTVSTNVLTFVIDTTMTACAGRGTAEIAIKDTANDVLFATFNMPVFVERAAVPEGSIDADVERAQEIAEEVEELIDGATEGAEAWAVGQRGGVDVESTDETYHNNAKYYAEQAADSAASIGIDATLTQTGKAADAKKTGDEISALKEDLSSIQTATASDVGKALKVKTVTDGKVTEWEFGDTGAHPTDEQVAEAVEAYLDEHPVSALDATNAPLNSVPVADGSDNWTWKASTEAFLVDITAFGGYADGTHAEETEQAINDALAWAKQNGYDKAVFPDGTYLIQGYDSTKADGSSAYVNRGVVPPSNMEIELSPNAVIKVAPNSRQRYSALYIVDKTNVYIHGGHFVGDRFDHDYETTSGTHEWGGCARISASTNVTLEGIEFKDFTGDAINLSNKGWYSGDGYVPALNTRIIRCEIHRCRRNGISIGGATNTYIIECLIHDNGTTIDDIAGTMPRAGIDIEGYADGSAVVSVPLGTQVLNNIFVDNGACDLNMFTSVNAVVSGNRFNGQVACSYAYQAVLTGNMFVGSGTGIAISFTASVSRRNFMNLVNISGNTIYSYATGILIKGDFIAATNNLISECENGISVSDPTGRRSSDILVSGNSISKFTYGYVIYGGTNISVKNNLFTDGTTAFRQYTSSGDYISIEGNTVLNITGKVISFTKRSDNDGTSRLLFCDNIIRNIHNSTLSTALMTISENVPAMDIVGNLFENVEVYSIISVDDNSSAAAEDYGRITIAKNTFKDCACRTAVIKIANSHMSLVKIVSNIFAMGGNYKAIRHAGVVLSSSVIASNIVYAIDPTISLTTAIELAQTFGKVIRNIILSGVIVATASDELIGNYIADSSSNTADYVQFDDLATTTKSGAMSAQDKSRLDTIYADYSSALTALGVI